MIAAPERELMAAAFEARRTGIIVTALVILLALPLAWFTANQIARPMRILAREARDIAGGHHETMIGTGYPKKLRREEMSLTARMMTIADILKP